MTWWQNVNTWEKDKSRNIDWMVCAEVSKAFRPYLVAENAVWDAAGCVSDAAGHRVARTPESYPLILQRVLSRAWGRLSLLDRGSAEHHRASRQLWMKTLQGDASGQTNRPGLGWGLQETQQLWDSAIKGGGQKRCMKTIYKCKPKYQYYYLFLLPCGCTRPFM